MDDATAMEPVEATQPTVAMEPVTVNGTEPCPHCGSPLALDQRYCLECGAPRTYLSGMLLDHLRASSAQDAPAQLQPSAGAAGGASGTLPPSSSSSSAWPRGNVLTLIAGVGVLLLAMGVGVLIGRSGGSSPATPAPQVITVGGTASGAAGTTTTPTTPEETSAAAKSGAAATSAATAAKHKAKAAEPAGTGSSPSKPAPPSVLKELGKGSGASNEQKSKNLPNVVSTG